MNVGDYMKREGEHRKGYIKTNRVTKQLLPAVKTYYNTVTWSGEAKENPWLLKARRGLGSLANDGKWPFSLPLSLFPLCSMFLAIVTAPRIPVCGVEIILSYI